MKSRLYEEQRERESLKMENEMNLLKTWRCGEKGEFLPLILL